jgi:hypothetical protein
MHIARGMLSFAGALAIACGLSLVTPRLAQAVDFGSAIGTWEGSLNPVNGPGLHCGSRNGPAEENRPACQI